MNRLLVAFHLDPVIATEKTSRERKTATKTMALPQLVEWRVRL